MKLSDAERQSLARMERLVLADDPAFAARMAWPNSSSTAGGAAFAPTSAARRAWRALALGLMVAVLPIAVCLLVVGSVTSEVWALVVGSALVLVDVVVSTRWWLARRRTRGGVEGCWW